MIKAFSSLILWTSAVMIVAVGCDGPTSSSRQPHDLLIVSGNNQRGDPGHQLEDELVVKVVDRRGRPVPGVTVTFEVTAGDGFLSPAVVVTAGNGLAVTRGTLGPTAGPNTITATFDGLDGLLPTFNALAAGEVDEERGLARPAAVISVEIADTVLVADGISATRITATVHDSVGNGVAGEAVQFRVDAGTIELVVQTDAAGQATTTYLSAVNPNGVQVVTIEARSGNLVDEATLRLLGVRLVLAADEDSLAADGISQVTVTAVVTTEGGDPVAFVPVDFAATLGTLSAGSAPTDVTGRASVVYTSVASSSDVSGVEVRARSSGLNAATRLHLLGVRLTLVVSLDTIAADGSSQSIVQADVRRTDGAAVVGQTVRFQTTLGTLSSEEVETDAQGGAQTILVAASETGAATVSAHFGGGDGLVERASVAFVKGRPVSIVLISVEPPAIGVRASGDNETAIVTFEVRDERGNTVADGLLVHFRLDTSADGGEQVGPDSMATVGGRVQAAVSSGTRARTVRLIAETTLATGENIRSTPVPIAVRGGLPDQDHFSLASEPLNLAGRVLLGLEGKITAYVFDKFSNPVPTRTSIRFRTDGGGIQGAAQTNENGQATVTLFTAAPVPPGPEFLATITGQTVDENGRDIEASTLILFSGPTDPIELTGAGADSVVAGALSIPNGGDQIVTFRVSDDSGNPLMGGSTIRITSDIARVSGDANVTIPDALSGNTEFFIVVADPNPVEDPPEPPRSGSVVIDVRSPNGNRQLTFGLTVD